MDRLFLLIEAIKSAKEEVVDEILDNGSYVATLSNEEFSNLVNFLVQYSSLKEVGSFEKKLVLNIMEMLSSHDTLLFNSSSSDTINKLIDNYQATETITTMQTLLEISHLENITSDVVSRRMLDILKELQSHINLSTLIEIASVIENYGKCLPPPTDHLRFCSEIINQLLSLSTPTTDKFYSFMCGVTKVGSVIEKIWLLPNSPNNIILPCLSNIYTLIANSNNSDNPLPVQTCVFLDLIPNILIEKALENVVLSENESLTNLALALCDWLVKWPKAVKLSLWITLLFKMLTLSNKSAIVASVISLKAPKLFEVSKIPVFLKNTYPVLTYMLLTLRDEPTESILAVLESAVNLYNAITIGQSNLNSFKNDLEEVFFILNDKRSPSELPQSFLQILMESPRPSEEKVNYRISVVPALFESSTKFNEIVLDKNWLERRTATSYIGLLNLGNTCYINAIIIALFMNYDFSRAVLAATPMLSQSLLSKLQQVFMFLRFSYRPAFSPALFLKSCRPPWFAPGTQQDSSEFLRYFLDQLLEQEKLGRTVLQCDHRWTIGKESKPDSSNKDTLKELGGSSETSDPNNLQRITEEDFTSQPSFSQNVPNVDESISGTNVLSSAHSESVDSGISSVHSVGQDEKEETPGSVQRSLIHRIFGGKMTTTYKCGSCATESIHENFFTDLHLAFPEASSSCSPSKLTRQTPKLLMENEILRMEDLLEHYFKSEKLEGENRYHCDHCNELVNEAVLTRTVTEAPRHLLLTLLRFQYERSTQRRRKIMDPVGYPYHLKLPFGAGFVHYLLYAVVIHSGLSLDGGHYYTVSRESHLKSKDDKETNQSWFIFNDSQVSRINVNSLIELSNYLKKYPSDTPYLLVYSKCEDASTNLSKSSLDEPLLLSADLKKLVDEDNQKYVRERLTSSNSSRLWHSKKDGGPEKDGEDSFPDNYGSRFIF